MTDKIYEYPVMVQPLPEELGGGFYALVPDLPGCMSDGETPQEAFANAQDAIASWIEAAQEQNWPIPAPKTVEPAMALKAG
jgi:antitoxin HicB